MSYEVIDTSDLYQGKSYNDWAKEYFTWYFSEDPDGHNDGPVVFLKSTPRINSTSDGNLSSFLQHMTEPNVMVGQESLDITLDQAIFIPAIVSYFSQVEPSDNYHTLKNFVRDAAANSETPRNNQIIIGERPTGRPITVRDMSRHYLETDVFILTVPDASSYKDYVEYPPLPTGTWPTVGGGYFFLIKFLRAGEYAIRSRVKGKKYQDGKDYYADLLYQINVS